MNMYIGDHEGQYNQQNKHNISYILYTLFAVVPSVTVLLLGSGAPALFIYTYSLGNCWG